MRVSLFRRKRKIQRLYRRTTGEEKMDLILLEIPAPGYDVERDRTACRAACLAAKLEVEAIQERIRQFETQHYEPAPGGGLKHRITVGLVSSNEEIDWGRTKLYQLLARKVEAHQAAVIKNAEIA
jgi:hypothetical protein